VNTVAPAISGDPAVGSLLTSTQGTWTGDAPISYAYQWRADGASISGATSQIYTTLIGDVGKAITCRVTATNPGGATSAISNSIVVTNVAFSPAELFAAGEQGAWYDPSDFSTMFQDSAGTTPVTAVGQSVGKINDKSGRNNHATQATAASRPVLRQDANNKYYLEFDAVDDSLATAAIDFTATDKITTWMGIFRSSSGSSIGMIQELGAGGVVGSYRQSAPEDASAELRLSCYSSGEPNRQYTSLSAPASSSEVVQCSYNLAGATNALCVSSRLNAVDGGSIFGASAGGGNFSNSALNIARRNNASFPFNGRIYSLIVRGALSTTQEITDTETWVAGKTGVTL
jgi:hypothetical protein